MLSFPKGFPCPSTGFCNLGLGFEVPFIAAKKNSRAFFTFSLRWWRVSYFRGTIVQTVLCSIVPTPH